MYGPTEKEVPYIAELRLEDTDFANAKALILEHGYTKFQWELVKKAINDNISPRDLMIAMLENTFASLHAITRMVNNEEFTEEMRDVLLEACTILVANTGVRQQ